MHRLLRAPLAAYRSWQVEQKAVQTLQHFWDATRVSGWRARLSELDLVTRKDGLALTVAGARARSGDSSLPPSVAGTLAYVPEAFVLPGNADRWRAAAARAAASSQRWIWKPANASRGEGVRGA